MWNCACAFVPVEFFEKYPNNPTLETLIKPIILPGQALTRMPRSVRAMLRERLLNNKLSGARCESSSILSYTCERTGVLWEYLADYKSCNIVLVVKDLKMNT